MRKRILLANFARFVSIVTVSELCLSERSERVSGGTINRRRSKTGENRRECVYVWRGGGFRTYAIYCAILFIRDSDSCQAAGSSYPTTAWTDPHARGAGIPVVGTLPTGWRVLSCSISGYP